MPGRKPPWRSSVRHAHGISRKEPRGTRVERVVIRDGDAISQMLADGAHLGTGGSAHPARGPATANRLANFDDANLRPAPRGGGGQCAVERAGDPRRRRPDHLAAGDLPDGTPAGVVGGTRCPRRSADDQDAIAGRIRRLLELADRRAGVGHSGHWGGSCGRRRTGGDQPIELVTQPKE